MGWTVRDQFLVGVTFFTPDQTIPGTHPASYTMGTVSFLEVKWLGHGFDHTSQSCAKVKGRVSRTVPHLLFCAFMAGYSLKLYLLLSRMVTCFAVNSMYVSVLFLNQLK